jgi:hypothetical protein
MGAAAPPLFEVSVTPPALLIFPISILRFSSFKNEIFYIFRITLAYFLKKGKKEQLRPLFDGCAVALFQFLFSFIFRLDSSPSPLFSGKYAR